MIQKYVISIVVNSVVNSDNGIDFMKMGSSFLPLDIKGGVCVCVHAVETK